MESAASGWAATPRPRPSWRRRLLALIALGVAAFIGLFAWCAIQAGTYPVDALADRVPKRTAMMRQREAEARRRGREVRVVQRWVPYSRISPQLRRAVLIAEDAAFYQHGGLDWNEIKASARKNWERRRVVRGGSTITQQLAKNLFLGDARTPTRKLTEIALAWRLERALSKQRIFELYLNLIEWGDGIYGIDAASRHYFGVPASAINSRQALLLAAVIINPRRFSVLSPPARIQRRVRMIAGRMRRLGYLSEDQYRAAVGLPPAVDTLAAAPMDSVAPLPVAEPEPPPVDVPVEEPAPPDTSAVSP